MPWDFQHRAASAQTNETGNAFRPPHGAPRLVRHEHGNPERLRHALEPRRLRPKRRLPLDELVAGEVEAGERGDAVDDDELRPALDDGALERLEPLVWVCA